MPSYTHKNWVCPFYKWDERLRIHCEGGRQCYPDRQAAQDYAQRYCTHMQGWKSCSVADSLLRYYERADEPAAGGLNEIAPVGAVK